MQHARLISGSGSATIVATLLLALTAHADVTGSPTDEAAIRKFIDADPLGISSPPPAPQRTAEHADFLNVFGGWTQGTAEFTKRISTPQGAAFFKGKTREHTIESIRFVRPDVAIVIVKFFNARDNGKLTGEDTRASYVLTKEGGQWEMTLFHNTPIVPGRGGNPPAKLP